LQHGVSGERDHRALPNLLPVDHRQRDVGHLTNPSDWIAPRECLACPEPDGTPPDLHQSAAQPTQQVGAALRAEAEDAVREITRFDAEVTAIAERRAAREGDDAATELAPLASVLLRTESASSSEIEGVTAGARALAMAAIDAKAGPNAQLVTANVTAMQRAVALADNISVDTILAAHQALLDRHAYAAPGRVRDHLLRNPADLGAEERAPESANMQVRGLFESTTSLRCRSTD
jgi:hypothetical protein